MGKNLTLTGMMGVGKTTIGKLLAKKLNYKFIDVDKLIEDREGLSISFIFKNKSESYFRKIENDITLSELKKCNSVISLGGGAFLNNSIRKSAKKLSTSFWLDVPIDNLIKRLKEKKEMNLQVVDAIISALSAKESGSAMRTISLGGSSTSLMHLGCASLSQKMIHKASRSKSPKKRYRRTTRRRRG